VTDTLELAAVVVLLGIALLLDRRVFGLVAAQPDGDARAHLAGLDHARVLLLPIAAALIAHRVAIYAGHRRLGIELACGILALNSLVVAATRVTALRRAGFPAADTSRMCATQLASSAAMTAAFVVIGAYLLRW
jgi:hypothetical protein